VLQGKLAALEAAHESLQEQWKSLRATMRSAARRVPAGESSPPVRRAGRKVVVGKTSKVKNRA